MIKNFKKNDNGFTLIELIVVMIIIGILVLLATPRFVRYIEEARYTRIINDIRVVETVSMPEMARNNMEFPRGTEEEETDLSTFANDKRAYMKDGIIGVRGISVEFTSEVGNISEFGPDDIKTGYHKLDKKGFIKPETKTRLKGDFYINKEGYVVYVDDKAAKGETITKEEFVDRTGLFFYDDEGGNPGTIIGINSDHEYFKDSKNKVEIDYLYNTLDLKAENPYPDKTYKFPQIPDTRIRDGEEIRVTVVESIKPKGLVGQGVVFKMDNLIFGDNIEIIKENAFEYSKQLEDISEGFPIRSTFSLIVNDGSLDLNKVKTIEKQAFKSIVFKDDSIDFKNVETIGEQAFTNSKFKGEFRANNLKTIGDYAFSNSVFTGGFDSGNIVNIGKKAFENSKFEGEFRANKIKNIDINAFKSSKFTGSFDSKNIENIGSNAFYKSEFEGEFIAGDSLKDIGIDAFYNSKFTGNFDSKNIESIGSNAFYNSKFDKKFIVGDKLKTIGNYAFYISNFDSKFDANNIERIGNYAFYFSKFTGERPVYNKLGEEIIIGYDAFGSGCFK